MRSGRRRRFSTDRPARRVAEPRLRLTGEAGARKGGNKESLIKPFAYAELLSCADARPRSAPTEPAPHGLADLSPARAGRRAPTFARPVDPERAARAAVDAWVPYAKRPDHDMRFDWRVGKVP